ncbi:putative stress-induced protein STI1 [Thelephora terrestris]|uniref:Stress-induced protein STI1 n=1 Tax=Thelephora terrestris TaxID=56493 RepID=A0A9P6L6Y2_9AGAM|nr:putative stress-induced protein STI1 [Thelephora terrestris]
MSQQKLVYAIIEFLNKSLEDGTVKQDDKEGLEVAIQCIGEAFGVDPSDKEQSERLSIKPTTLESVFGLFLKTRDKVASSSSQPKPAGPTAEDKASAEKLKQKGNTLMSGKKYDEAIQSYTEAINLDSTNPVYFSNRAAAYSSKGDHLLAVGDAEKAIEVEPSYVKAYHRLGHAHYSLGDFKEASAAFQRGLDVEPGNPSLTSALNNAEARLKESEPPGETQSTPPAQPGAGSNGMDLGGMAEMLRGVTGGGPGGGGAPDLSGLLNNPMMAQMAQSMMANGGLERLMQNPSVANMMNRVQSGGGMPSMAELMSDPGLRDL